MMVEEAIIERTIDHYESNEEDYVRALSNLMEDQPALLAFLNQESTDILKEEEKDILWYITLIMYDSIVQSGIDIFKVSDSALGENEEKNWSILQEQTRGSFRERVTPFFTDYQEEDLLAFVEDTLEVEDDSPITNVGREVIFISSKSIIDTLLPTK